MYKSLLLALIAALSLASQDAFASPLEGGRVMLMARRNMMVGGAKEKITLVDYVETGYDAYVRIPVTTNGYTISTLEIIGLSGNDALSYGDDSVCLYNSRTSSGVCIYMASVANMLKNIYQNELMKLKVTSIKNDVCTAEKVSTGEKIEGLKQIWSTKLPQQMYIGGSGIKFRIRDIVAAYDGITRHLVPARVGNVGLLYDETSGEEYYPQGGGSFVVGPDK